MPPASKTLQLRRAIRCVLATGANERLAQVGIDFVEVVADDRPRRMDGTGDLHGGIEEGAPAKAVLVDPARDPFEDQRNESPPVAGDDASASSRIA